MPPPRLCAGTPRLLAAASGGVRYALPASPPAWLVHVAEALHARCTLHLCVQVPPDLLAIANQPYAIRLRK